MFLAEGLGADILPLKYYGLEASSLPVGIAFLVFGGAVAALWRITDVPFNPQRHNEKLKLLASTCCSVAAGLLLTGVLGALIQWVIHQDLTSDQIVGLFAIAVVSSISSVFFFWSARRVLDAWI